MAAEHVLLCYLRSGRSDTMLRDVAAACAELGAKLSVVMPIVDAAIPDGCCGIQGEQWRRLTDEDSRDALRRAVHLLDSLGCPPVDAAIEVGPSVPEIARSAAARCECDVIAVGARRHAWSGGGLSRRQLERLRDAQPREVLVL
jgi:nucleotide-binding universal stress UspA family protein